MTTRCAWCWPWLWVFQVIKDYAPADQFPGCGDLTIKAGQRVAIEKRGNDHMFGRYSSSAWVEPWRASHTAWSHACGTDGYSRRCVWILLCCGALVHRRPRAAVLPGRITHAPCAVVCDTRLTDVWLQLPLSCYLRWVHM